MIKNSEIMSVKNVLKFFLFIYIVVISLVLIINKDFAILAAIILPIVSVIVIICINNIKFTLLIYIVLTPIIQHFSIIHVNFGSFIITPDMVLHFLLLIITLNYIIYTYNNKVYIKFNIQDKILLLFVLFSFYSLIGASDIPINHEKRFLLYYTGIFQTVSFYFVILYFLNKYNNFDKTLIISVCITPVFAGIVAFLELKEIGLNLLSIFLSRMTIGFGYHNTNLFGMHVAIIFPLIFYTLTSDEFKNYRIILWISFIIIIILSLLTLNRGTFIVIITNLLLLYRYKENRKIIFSFILAGLAIFIKYSDLFLIYLNRFLGGYNASTSINLDQSALYRLEVWNAGLNAILNHPFGLGGTGFTHYWSTYGSMPSIQFLTPHHLFLYIGVDYGVPALLIFLFFLVITIRNNFLILKNKNNISFKLHYYFMVSLIGYIIHGILTGGEFSHLSGNLVPNNGYTYMLMIVLALISFYYHKFLSEWRKS